MGLVGIRTPEFGVVPVHSERDILWRYGRRMNRERNKLCLESLMDT